MRLKVIPILLISVTCIPPYKTPSSFVKFKWPTNRSELLSWHFSWLGKKLYDKQLLSPTHSNWQDSSDIGVKSFMTLPYSLWPFRTSAKLIALKLVFVIWSNPCAKFVSEHARSTNKYFISLWHLHTGLVNCERKFDCWIGWIIYNDLRDYYYPLWSSFTVILYFHSSQACLGMLY